MTASSDLEGFFTQKMPFRIMLEINRTSEPFASDIQKEVDTQYAHAVNTISEMEDRGLLTRMEKGRKKIITLTDEGQELASEFERLDRVFNEVENQ